MCIVFVYNGSQDEDSDYSLIIASNRDEYFERPAKNMWYWEEDPNIIGGRDLQADCDRGTWLALSPSRRKLGVLLNLPNTPKPNAKSRGRIVADFVKTEVSTYEYIKSLETYFKECNDFVFIAIEFNKLVPSINAYSNTSNELSSHSNTDLGFGNSLPDEPLKKVEAGRKQMNEICKRFNKIINKEDLIMSLVKLLKSDERHLPDPELEKKRPAAYKQLSSIFVNIPEKGYGTRTHTLILMTKTGKVDAIEISLQPPISPENLHWKRTELEFDL